MILVQCKQPVRCQMNGYQTGTGRVVDVVAAVIVVDDEDEDGRSPQ